MKVKDSWTESEKFLQNSNGKCCVWENNRENDAEEITLREGIEKEGKERVYGRYINHSSRYLNIQKGK